MAAKKKAGGKPMMPGMPGKKHMEPHMESGSDWPERDNDKMKGMAGMPGRKAPKRKGR